MAVSYKGVIAGIGSKQDDINVIMPNLDAQLRNFIVGKSGIISGFELNDKYLTAGVCIHDGFIGTYPFDISNISATIEEEITEERYYYCNYGEPVMFPPHLAQKLQPINDENVSDTSNVDSFVGIHRFVFDYLVVSCEVRFATSSQSLPPEDTTVSILGNVVDITVNRTDLLADGIAIVLSVTLVVGTKEVPAPANFIYGRFTVNHDKNKLDSFEIVPAYRIIEKKDDILNEAGTYDMLLYSANGLMAERLKYPAKAEYSDYAKRVDSYGKLENGVTAATQDVNDNSTKVATTEYVHNQIVEEINEQNLNISDVKNFISAAASSLSVDVTVKINGKRKAKLSVLHLVSFVFENKNTILNQAVVIAAGTILYQLPLAFAAKQVVPIWSRADGTAILINENGEIYFNKQYVVTTVNGTDASITVEHFGYETK